MFIHKKTGVVFKSRKDAIEIMGQVRYKKFLEQKEFEFDSNMTDDELKKVQPFIYKKNYDI